MKRVIYTALFWNYDKLRDPKKVDTNIDYICFTDDKKLSSKAWKIIYIKPVLSPNMENRRYKILTHKFLKEYDQSLYIDANIQIINKISKLFDEYLSNSDIACPKHLERNCAYQEFEKCIEIGLVNKKMASTQKVLYEKEWFPKNFWLYEMSIIFRNHKSEKVIDIMTRWFNQLEKYTQRDQLSFWYSLWKNWKANIKQIKENSRLKNKYFKIFPHNRATKLSYYFDLIYMRKKYNIFYKFIYLIIKNIRSFKKLNLSPIKK